MYFCVTGTSHSGVSLVARMLYGSGLPLLTSAASTPSLANTEQDEAITSHEIANINLELLKWRGASELDENRIEREALLLRLQNIIQQQATHPHWGWADIYTGELLEAWLAKLPDLKVVLCIRQPIDVAYTLSGGKEEAFEQALASWQTYYEGVLAAAKPSQVVVTHYESWIYDGLGELKRVISQLGLKLDESQLAHPDSSLTKHTYDIWAARPYLEKQREGSGCMSLYLSLCDKAGEILKQLQNDLIYQADVAYSVSEAYFNVQQTQLHMQRANNLNSHTDQHIRDYLFENMKLKDQLMRNQALANHFEQRLVSTEHALWKIQRSRGWRMVQAVRQITGRIIPPSSKRRRVLQLWTAAWKTFRADGPKGLIERSSRWVKGERRYGQNAALTNLELKSYIKRFGEVQFLEYPISDLQYRRHVQHVEPSLLELYRQIEFSDSWENPPLISVVTPVYKPDSRIFKETAHSIHTQTYRNWEWVVVDASPNEDIWAILAEQAAQDIRIRPFRIEQNQGIADNTNYAMEKSRGEFIVLLDHDDTLAPNALYEVAQIIRQGDADLVYSDEDKLDEVDARCEPFYKPDWSPDMMLCVNHITHLCAFRRSLMETVGGMNPEMDGAQDWDYFLRISEQTDRIIHIPKILYHWRKSASSTAQATDNKMGITEAQTSVIQSHLERTGILEPQVHFTDPREHLIHSVHPLVTWKQRRVRRISIIIPTLDNIEILRNCVRSISRLTAYEDYEIILVDTGSKEAATFEFYEQYESNNNARVVYFHEPFNFSKACNFGAVHATGELLLFLNNDTEVMHPEWLQWMAQWFERPGVGVVGAKLLYPDGKIQHAGVIVGFGGLAGHLFIQEYEQIATTLFGTDCWYRNLLAVTGACLMISREAYDKVEGFDEHYQLNYSDVALCVRAYEAGYRIVYTPHVRLIHHESMTHQRKIPRVDFERASESWRMWFEKGDPFFNPNLSYGSAMPTFQMFLNDTAVERNQYLMRKLPAGETIRLPDDIPDFAVE